MLAAKQVHPLRNTERELLFRMFHVMTASTILQRRGNISVVFQGVRVELIRKHEVFMEKNRGKI